MKIATQRLIRRLSVALLTLFTASQPHAAVVLQYHHIDTTTPSVTSTSPKDFEDHLNYIASTKLRVVTLASIVETPDAEVEIEAGGRADDRIAITFDDAYLNILENAIPLLRERNWPFTVFVSTQIVGQKGYLSWDQLREIEAAGGSIANHTHTHTHMLRRHGSESLDLWRARMKNEIMRAQALLEKHLKSPARHFAYPYGEYNLELLTIVGELNFAGFGQQSGAVGRYSHPALLPRFPLNGIYADLTNFKTKVHSQALPAQVEFHPPMTKDNPPTLTLRFEANSTLRLSELRCYGPGGLTTLEFTSDFVAEAKGQTPIPTGRSRYNCTMPMSDNGQFYWFSQLWIQKQADGTWYPEY